MDEVVKALILGMIQGFTEFLPISSTGHLVIGRKFLNLSEAGLFLDTMLHFGTLIAVIAVFWDDVIALIKKPFSRLGLLIIVGTIPTAIIGLAFEDFFEAISKTGSTIGVEFIVTGLILWFADEMKNKGGKGIDRITWRDALFVGTLQGAAILPAISRSGLTIAGSLFCRIEKRTAARFSFLLSLPAIFGACLLQGKKLLTEQAETIGLMALFVGTFAAAICGYIAVKWMLNILNKGSLKMFSVYVFALGGLTLILQLAGLW